MLGATTQPLPEELQGNCSHHHLLHPVWFMVEGGSPSECFCANPDPTVCPAPPLGYEEEVPILKGFARFQVMEGCWPTAFRAALVMILNIPLESAPQNFPGASG